MSLGIVLVSGGLDSCVAAAIAARRGPLAFLHLRYRQRTEEREFAAFSALADHFQVETRLVVDVDYMRQIGGSSLVDATQPIPENEAAAGLPTTYVPFRNANLLGVAVAWAEVIGATDIYIGAHEARACTQTVGGNFSPLTSAWSPLVLARKPKCASRPRS